MAASNTVGSNLNLPVDAILDSRVETIIAMGFDSKLAGHALKNSNGNLDEAITMLSNGMVPEPDEFDLLDNQGSATAKVSPVDTKPLPAKTPKGVDPFRAGLAKDAPASAVVDSRVQQLMEMGFGAEAAEKALSACNNDFNAAVDLLTNG